MIYKVVKAFYDLEDGNHRYNVGDFYPRNAKKAQDKRIEELSGNNNKQGVPLIAKVEPVKTETKTVKKVENKPKTRRVRKKEKESE